MSLIPLALFLFLAIFTFTAILTLLSLINVVKIERHYQKQLFRLVILEVVGVVIGYVVTEIRRPHDIFMTEELLISGPEWDSSFPEKNWRTQGRFVRTADGIEFVATTFVSASDRPATPIIEWHSLKPFAVSSESSEIAFPVTAKWTPAATSVYPTLEWEAGKSRNGTMKLKADLSLRGSWIAADGPPSWGVMFTKSWH